MHVPERTCVLPCHFHFLLSWVHIFSRVVLSTDCILLISVLYSHRVMLCSSLHSSASTSLLSVKLRISCCNSFSAFPCYSPPMFVPFFLTFRCIFVKCWSLSSDYVLLRDFSVGLKLFNLLQFSR